MSQFTPPTIDEILSDIRSIASASDFGEFVAQSIAKQTRMNPNNYQDRRIPEQWFPFDPDSSTIDALLDTIAALAPIPLPREMSFENFENKEHTWLACIRRCAKQNQIFCDPEDPRHPEVVCRLVDVLMFSFTMEPESEGSDAGSSTTSAEEDRADKDDALCFQFVATTLAALLEPQHLIGASDALIDFLVRGLVSEHCRIRECYVDYSGNSCTRVGSILVQAIFQSASLGKWIAQVALGGYSTRKVVSEIHRKVFDHGSTVPPFLGDPENIRLLFRSLHIVGKKGHCGALPKILEAILDNFPLLPLAFLNAPLNLLDEEGVLIEDTLLSIASQGTHCCEECHAPLWHKLVKHGADVNGLVDDPADPTKKIVSRRDGKTPAMLACATGCDKAVSFFLMSEDLDLTLKDIEGKNIVNHLLRRFECQKRHLKHLYDRDPEFFVKQVTFADLDFAVRNGIHRSVIFLLTLKNVQFDVSDLQAMFNFCFELLINSRLNEVKYPQRGSRYCEMFEYEEPDIHQNCFQFSFPRIWIRHLSLKLRELGSAGVMASFAGLRDRSPSSDAENKMGDDDDDRGPCGEYLGENDEYGECDSCASEELSSH